MKFCVEIDHRRACKAFREYFLNVNSFEIRKLRKFRDSKSVYSVGNWLQKWISEWDNNPNVYFFRVAVYRSISRS